GMSESILPGVILVKSRVPPLRVGTRSGALRVAATNPGSALLIRARDAERPGARSHAERGNEKPRPAPGAATRPRTPRVASRRPAVAGPAGGSRHPAIAGSP